MLESTLTTPLTTELLPTASLLPTLSTLRQSSGLLTLNNGQLTSEFKTPTGETESTLRFDQGSVTSNLTSASGDLTGTIAFSQVIGNTVSEVVKSISGSVPFANGQLNIDVPTEMGEVKGTIEFGNGALVTNLATPTGNYFSSIDFKEQDQFKFNAGNIPGVVNFNDGLVVLALQPQIQGDKIAVPINAIRGTIAFKNGQATLSVPTPFGSFNTNFDLSALAAQTATNALEV